MISPESFPVHILRNGKVKQALVLSLFFLLASCAGPTVITQTAKRPIEGPYKKEPAYAKVPPTQRPYRINGRTYYPLPSAQGFMQKGIASWYGKKFHGRKTSNGETYNMWAKTAAHKTLPMGTMLLVKNLGNDKETLVRINDRGPFVKGRIIDLSLTAAKEIDMVGQGTAQVRITALGESVTYESRGKKVERFLPHQDFDKGEFFVQIGSFEYLDNASRLKEKLLTMGKKTVIQKFDQGDKVFYRVQVRAGTDLTAAGRMERVLEHSGYPGAFVVAR